MGIGHRTLPEGSGCPAAHAVAAAAIELTVERYGRRVSVSHRHTAVKPSHQRRSAPQHDFPADAQIGAEILRILDAENRILLLSLGRREEGVLDGVDQVAGGLGVEPDVRGISAEVLALVVIAVAERKAADELGLETVDQVFVGGIAQEFGIDRACHVDHVDVDRPQREGRIAAVGPHVGDAGARKRTGVIGAVLKIDRQFDLGLRLVHRAETARAPGHEEPREGQSGRDAEFGGPLAPGVGSLHKFVTRREGEVERLGAAENIAVLITDGGLQAVETRRGAAFEVDLDALLERRRAENVARQVALARVERLRRIGRSADEGDDVGDVGRPGLLLEGDFRALEIPQRHQVGIGAIDLRRVVDVVGIERHGLTEHRRAQVGPFLVDDVQTAVVDRIEPRKQRRVGPCDGGVVIGENVDPVDTVDHVVVHHGQSAFVVAREILFDDQPQVDQPLLLEHPRGVGDVVDREIVVPPLLEVGGDALPLGIEDRHVVNIARMQQRIDGVGQHDLFEEVVLELVGNGVDAVRLALARAEGDRRTLAARNGVDLIGRLRGEKTLRVHVDLQVFGALLGQPHVQRHGRLPDLALPVVPAVVLRRVGLLVEPDVEIRPEEAFVGSLAHVLLHVGSRDAFLAGRGPVVLDLYFLQKILSFGNVARDAARRAQQAQQRGGEYATRSPHGVSC